MAIRRAVVYYSRVRGLPSHLVQELNVSTLGVYFHMNFMLTQKHSDPQNYVYKLYVIQVLVNVDGGTLF